MDKRLERALEHSNLMVTLNNQKNILKQKFYSDRIFYCNGGKFTVTKELIAFVKVATPDVIDDDNCTPIEVDDKFYEKILTVYNEAITKYYTEYKKLSKNRTVEGLVSV